VNTRAHDIAVVLRSVLGMLPAATGISCHVCSTWTFVVISASTDAAVDTLSYDLGLGVPERRSDQTASWLRAMSERDAVRVEVFGPHRPDQFPAQ
jgi:hypothetical protein